MNEPSEPTTTTKRRAGSGSVYDRDGVLWIKYHRNGKPYRESAHTSDMRKAEKFLKFSLQQIAGARFVEPRAERTMVRELAEPFFADLRLNQRKDIVHAQMRWRQHLEPFFGDLRVAEVTGSALKDYVAHRQKQGAKADTVARELAALRRMFNLGYGSDPQTVLRVPPFPQLKPSRPRQGFLVDADYDRLAAECAREGLWLRAMLAVFYNFGWRKAEVAGLRARQVDLGARTIRLEVGATKNDAGRTVKMPQDVLTLLTACMQGKQGDDFVFTRENGDAAGDFRRSWRRACQRAGVPGLLVHDLRRTGARNLRRLGVAEGTIMKIGGWKTRSVFQRYDIVSEADLDDAARRLDETGTDHRLWAQFGHNGLFRRPGSRASLRQLAVFGMSCW